MHNDEIINEVRAIREAHAEKFNYDLQAIYEDLKKTEAAHIAAGRRFIAVPITPPQPNSSLQRTRFPDR